MRGIEPTHMDRIDIAGLMADSPTGGPLINSGSALSADKYAVAVIKAREVVTLNAGYRADRLPESLERMVMKFDRLLGFLLSQFRVETTTEEVRRVMKNTANIDALNEDELSDLSDGVVPIALVRELLSKHRIMIDPRKLGNWDAFATRYEMSVLYA